MADDPQTIRSISWREVLPFTNIFRAFRIAIHPSKLVLALAALLLWYAGGRLLDWVWPVDNRAVVDVSAGRSEVDLYDQWKGGFGWAGREASARLRDRSFREIRQETRREIEDDYARLLGMLNIEPDMSKARSAARDGAYLGQVKEKVLQKRKENVDALAKVRDESLKAIDDDTTLSAETKVERKTQVHRDYEQGVSAVFRQAYEQFQRARSIRNEGIFAAFFEYELRQVNNLVRAVPALDLFTSDTSVVASLYRFFVTGPGWLISQHWLYAILLLLLLLVLWALFGGAVARIAAVHVARDEKLSIRSALRFSVSKFLSFMFAPIIPIIIILIIGLVLAVGGLLGNIPFIGPIIVGAMFFLALAAGFVMTLVLLGLIGGFNLMYPTVAVEGSDSFDAISRSFSYLYARPWRLIFYTLVALIYGALTYLFVRLFLTLMLGLTHAFVGVGFSFSDADNLRSMWNTMWPGPGARLVYDIDFLTLGTGGDIGAFLVALWVYLAVALLGAFAISFYLSANTIIYFLMRQEVDATEMDDVYVEPVDDEFAETPTGETAPAQVTGPGATTTTPAAPATPAVESSSPPPSTPPQTGGGDNPPANPG